MKRLVITITLIVLQLSSLAQFAPQHSPTQNNVRNNNFSQSPTQQQTKTYKMGETFDFQPNGTILYSDYKNNHKALQWLNNTVINNRLAILSDKAYFLIIAFIPQFDAKNPIKENNASLQAHVLRSYMLTQYGIPNNKCVFAIDTTQGLQNKVNLQLISGQPSKFDNKEIKYSNDKSFNHSLMAMNQYSNGVPYTSYLMHLAKHDPNFANGGELYALNNGMWIKAEDFDKFAQDATLAQIASTVGTLKLFVKLPNGTFRVATPEDINGGIHMLYTRDAYGQYSFATAQDIGNTAKEYHQQIPTNNTYIATLPKVTDHQPQPQPQPQQTYNPAPPTTTTTTTTTNEYTKPQKIQPEPKPTKERKEKVQNVLDYSRTKPIFAIKTNIPQWLIAMPNAQAEFFFGSMTSLNIEGGYTYLTEILENEKTYWQWNVGADFRFWFKSNKRFEGLYIGPYGMYGEYDIKFNEEGNQGDYYSFGAVFGYLLPLNKHFNMEFGIGGGYYRYSNTKYYYDDGRFVVSDSNNPVNIKTGLFPTKATISLVWKF